MVRRLLAGVTVAAVLSLVAACGGSSSSSSTPTAASSATASPTPTPHVQIPGELCRGTDLAGAFVSEQGAAGTIFYQLGVTNVGGLDCFLVNPPKLHFKNAAGVDLGVVAHTDADCPAGGPYDPASCVDEDAVDLPPGAPTPAIDAPPGQLTVTVAALDISVLAPCASPTLQAHFITLRFTGTTEDVRIELPNDIDLQTCVGQVRLHGYGPSF